jgi:hypothetical protein
MRVIEFPSVVMLDFRTGAIPEAHATVGPALNDSDERRAAHCPGFAGAKFVLGDFFRGRRFPQWLRPGSMVHCPPSSIPLSLL